MEMKNVKLCILLLDIVGSTKFVQKYGNVHAAKIFQAHDKLTRSLIYKFNGREIDRSDGFLMSFNSVLDAVNFSCMYHSTIPPKTTLQARVGIHWGDIIEVSQEDKFIDAGAKRVELEGINKNTAARIMSLAQGGQTLMTPQAFQRIKGRRNLHTPRNLRGAHVGTYKLKGVKKPINVYVVGTTIESMQPPPDSDKVKKVKGPKKIKSKYSEMTAKEWREWIFHKITIFTIFFSIYSFISIITDPYARHYFKYFTGISLDVFEFVDELIVYLKELSGEFYERK